MGLHFGSTSVTKAYVGADVVNRVYHGATLVFQGPAAEPWDPIDIAPTAWAESDDAATLTLNGSAVSQWADKSGNLRHFDQATAAEQPNGTARTVNALAVIDFDGTDDYLQGGTAPSLLAEATNPFEISIAFVADGYGTIMSQNITNSGSGQQFHLYNSSGGTINLILRGGTATSLGAYTLGTPMTAHIRYDGTNAYASLSNGAEVSVPVGTAAAETGALLKLGARSNTSTTNEYNFLDGAIGEVIISGTLTTADRDEKVNYINYKWLGVGTPPDTVDGTPVARMTLAEPITVGTAFDIFMLTSSDPDGDDSLLTLDASITSQPTGSAVSLVNVKRGHWQLTATHAGDYVVRGTATDPGGLTDDVIRTFPASESVSGAIAGDWDTEGVENYGPDALWVGTGSRTNGKVTVVNSGYEVPGAWEKWGVFEVTEIGRQANPRIHRVTGKPWAVEIVPYNSGEGYLKGLEWRCDPADLVWPTDDLGREYAYFRFCVMYPNRFKCSGDMKIPDVSGWKNRNESYTSSGKSSGPAESFSAGAMTGYTGTRHRTVAEGGRLVFKHYLLADEGPGSFDASVEGHNYYSRIDVSPTSSTDYEIPLGDGVWNEVIMYVRCNRPNMRDGVWSFWTQRAGQARVLRENHTDMQWVTTGASNMFLKFRSFWGGPSEDRPGWSRFGGPSVGDDTDLDEAPHFRDFWIGSAMPPLPRV